MDIGDIKRVYGVMGPIIFTLVYFVSYSVISWFRLSKINMLILSEEASSVLIRVSIHIPPCPQSNIWLCDSSKHMIIRTSS